MPGLAGRIALALLAAAAAIVALDRCVTRRDRQRAAGAQEVVDQEPPALRTRLGFRLGAVAGPIALVASDRAIAPDTAPVLQVFADGDLVLRRPAPLPTAPDGRLVRGGRHGAAIVLPERTLALLSPAARGTLLDLLQQLVVDRPVPAERIAVIDVVVATGDLATLLAWVP